MTVDGLAGAFMPGQAAMLIAGTWSVRITDGAGCVFDTLIVMPQGTQLALTVPTQIHVSAGDETTVTLTGGFQPGGVGQVTWTPDRFLSPTANPLVWIIRPEEDITYQVTVTTQEGCEAMASIQVLVNDLRRLYVPNAFSPNNVDGINDLFFPYSGEGGFDQIRSMDIYDRWGNHLFRQEDFPVSDADYGWDGTWRGRKLDPGVYVWVIEVDTGGGGTRLYRGDVILF
jgi:gliding motility-associated-like protein